MGWKRCSASSGPETEEGLTAPALLGALSSRVRSGTLLEMPYGKGEVWTPPNEIEAQLPSVSAEPSPSSTCQLDAATEGVTGKSRRTTELSPSQITELGRMTK